LPDAGGVLHPAPELTYDDAPWMSAALRSRDPADGEATARVLLNPALRFAPSPEPPSFPSPLAGGLRFVHADVGAELAEKLGARSLRYMMLLEEKLTDALPCPAAAQVARSLGGDGGALRDTHAICCYASSHAHLPPLDCGLHPSRTRVSLTPHHPTNALSGGNEGEAQLLLDLLEVADVLGAKAAHFCLDRRHHRAQSLLSPGLAGLQRDALCLWLPGVLISREQLVLLQQPPSDRTVSVRLTFLPRPRRRSRCLWRSFWVRMPHPHCFAGRRTHTALRQPPPRHVQRLRAGTPLWSRALDSQFTASSPIFAAHTFAPNQTPEQPAVASGKHLYLFDPGGAYLASSLSQAAADGGGVVAGGGGSGGGSGGEAPKAGQPTARSYPMVPDELPRRFPDQFAPLTTFGWRADGGAPMDGTLIRLPLRSHAQAAASALSRRFWSAARMRDLLGALQVMIPPLLPKQAARARNPHALL